MERLRNCERSKAVEMMIDFLRNYFSRPTSTRTLDAASGGRRWRDDRRGTNIANSLQLNASTIAARGQHFSLNTPDGTRMRDSIVGNLIGTGITPRPQHSVPLVRDRLAASFLAWTDTADASAEQDFYGLTASLVSDMVTLGEGLGHLGQNEFTGAPEISRLNPEQLDRAKNVQLKNGGHIVQGVEFNAKGKRVAYWIRPSAPGELLAGLSLVSLRYPANDIIHLYRKLVPGQVRGISWFAPILLSANDLDSLLDAMLVRAKVSAMYVGSIYDPDGTTGGFEGEQSGSDLDTTAEPGTIRVETNGSRLDWSDPPDSGDTVAFSKAMQRRLANGVGVTYEQASGDYSEINYGSARAALLEFRRFAGSIQHHVIIFQLCRPVWDAFVKWQVLSGQISASAYQSNHGQFHAVKWLPPAWQWIDPEKDAKAAILEMDNLIRSRSEIVAEKGYDIEALDREIAADAARQTKLGLAASKQSSGGQNVNA